MLPTYSRSGAILQPTAEDREFMADISPVEKRDNDSADMERRLDTEAQRSLNALCASTEADHRMHGVARVALLNLLATDPTVERLLWRWTRATTYGRMVLKIVETFGRCAETLGMENANEFRCFLANAPAGGAVTIENADESDRERISTTIAAQIAELNELVYELCEWLDLAEIDQITLEAMALVRNEWKLPWPWMAHELIRLWLCRLVDLVLGTKSTRIFWVEPNPLDRPAPAVSFNFETKPGETVAEALERFKHEAESTILHPLAAAASPLPKGRATQENIARRYVAWWYRRNVLNESIRSIADKNDGKRRLVRHGIEQADRWLHVANCVWKNEDAA